ncbi:MAG: hypothetical protein ABIQ59_14345 [Nocardioidaceae bacterium]
MTAAIAETDLGPSTSTHLARQTGRSVTLVDDAYGAERARNERLAAAAQRRAAARARDLTALLRDRPDLAGVHAPADFAVDAVRWCA